MIMRTHKVTEETKAPEVTEEMMLKTLASLSKRPRIKLRGKSIECPTCGGEMVYSEDLTFEAQMSDTNVVILNLSGHKCAACGEKAFDSWSSQKIEEATRQKVGGGYECRITRVGGRQLGLYFPKDVLREMEIRPSAKALIKPLTRKKALVEVG
jgi:YgiT-type zinc finger domain-containing protein